MKELITDLRRLQLTQLYSMLVQKPFRISIELMIYMLEEGIYE